MSRLKNCWKNMRQRCNNPNFTYYHNYGGRGIRICDEWQDYVDFEEWALANGYDDSLTLDRIDTNGNYEPSNCRWVTMKTQANNKRNNRLITINGETKTASQWADDFGIGYSLVKSRLHRGMLPEKAFENSDLRIAELITYKGKTQSITEWSHETGVSRKNISRRLKRGWSLDKVFSLHNFNFKQVTT